MDALELIEYGVQERYQNGEINPHKLVYIVYRYNGRQYCHAKAGRYEEIERMRQNEAGELLPEHDVIIELVKQMLFEQQFNGEVNTEKYLGQNALKPAPKKPGLFSKMLNWFYEVEKPEEFPEV